MAFDRNNDFLHRHARAARRAFDDPIIGLVGYDPVNLIAADPSFFHHLVGDVGQLGDRMAEDLFALHFQDAGTLGFGRSTRDVQDSVVGTVRV